MASARGAKRRKLSPSGESERPKTYSANENFVKLASRWNLEQDYERRPRKIDKRQKKQKLPIRTSEGWIEQEAEVSEGEAENEDGEQTGAAKDGSPTEIVGDEGVPSEASPQAPSVSSRQQILEAKEELASIAGHINEDPEEHIGSLKKLGQLAASPNLTVKKLALATQLAVYKDIIPGYRIRPLSEEDMKAKLSKEVRKLRTFEQSIVTGYQAYLRDLTMYAKGQSEGLVEQVASLKSVAISCTCNLLLAVPHFNFRTELLKIIVGRLSNKKADTDFTKCVGTLEQLFNDDEDGDTSLDAVLMLTKMIKAKDYRVHESVLNVFLQLRLLSEFSQKGSSTQVDREENDENTAKTPKKKREFRTKRMRKQLREDKALQKEMKEADAEVSHEDREKNQAEMLKAVFLTYLRILQAHKQKSNLMGAVLEGLAKYAHLINQDFFGDILETLKELIQQAEYQPATDPSGLLNADEKDTDDLDRAQPTRNAVRESLLCVTTAFALLHGQDARKAAAELHLDLSFFITHLYRTLLPLALDPAIEFGSDAQLPDPPSSSSAPDPDPPKTTTKVNHNTTTVLLLRALRFILLPPPPHPPGSVPPARLAAFMHRLLLSALHLPAASGGALVALLQAATGQKAVARKVAALWRSEERKGDGVCDLVGDSVEGCNGFAGTAWEGEVLRWHFDPKVREAWKRVERNVGAVGGS
ncbi:MAG: hypothetical protein M1822_007704 [Bathelium mastoideum]|nr:MAG: hypothetical protein M1822_007704 [Bathelium mastoideum]